MKVYALAAGYATRLHPLTLDRAKPLLEVAGAPILSHILGRVLPLPDLSEIIVIGNHRFHADLSAWAETFRAAHQAPPLQVLDDGSNDDDHKLGAIGDIAFGLQAVPPGGEDILVVAGDNLLAFDLRPLRQAFVEQGRRPTLVLRDVPVSHEPTRYNEVTLEPDGRVSRFREKPPEALTGLAAIALYFFPASVDEKLTQYLEAGGNPDAPGHFITWLVGQVEVGAVQFEGAWFDIGSLETLEEARRSFTRYLA